MPTFAPTFLPSANIANLAESATIAVSTRAKALRAAGRTIIDLGAGEPDMETPRYIIDAAHAALDAGATRYTQVDGIAPLRERIAQRASAVHGSTIDASQIVISTGTKQALFNACFSVFGAEDEVLVPTPAWTSYYEILSLARANAVVVRGSRANSFRADVDAFERAMTPRTRGIILNSPCNPTGAVYSARELRDIAELAERYGWWIISDEIYRAITYGVEATSVLSVVKDLDRTIVVDGVAKAFAMPGWRIGWSISAPESARAMTALQSHTTSNTATISQHAALAAVSNGPAEIASRREIIAAFGRRRAMALELLAAAGVEVIDPHGAFYFFINTATGDDGFAGRLLESAGVAVIPGNAFHAEPGWIRVSYAALDEQVAEGIRRVIAAMGR